MKLPNRKNVYIPNEKITDYILSETHSTGKFKAKFFATLGFDETNVDLFEKSLLNIVKTEEITIDYNTLEEPEEARKDYYK